MTEGYYPDHAELPACDHANPEKYWCHRCRPSAFSHAPEASLFHDPDNSELLKRALRAEEECSRLRELLRKISAIVDVHHNGESPEGLSRGGSAKMAIAAIADAMGVPS